MLSYWSDPERKCYTLVNHHILSKTWHNAWYVRTCMLHVRVAMHLTCLKGVQLVLQLVYLRHLGLQQTPHAGRALICLVLYMEQHIKVYIIHYSPLKMV